MSKDRKIILKFLMEQQNAYINWCGGKDWDWFFICIGEKDDWVEFDVSKDEVLYMIKNFKDKEITAECVEKLTG